MFQSKTGCEYRCETIGNRTVNGKCRVYPLGTEDKKVVNETFDDMHRQGRLKWTNSPTPFSYPVFVVWKSLPDGTRKGRTIVDIRVLNDLMVPNAYPVPLQSDIIADLRGCSHISVFDANSFFYQWRVHPDDTFKLTTVNFRGQETFLVPVMGCRNSIAYVQRQMDRILRGYAFARAYIDDVVIASHSMKEHLHHLRSIFQFFTKLGIAIKPTKAFLGYSDVNLLGQRVNSLGLSTSEEKLKAIAGLKFPSTLADLEHYLGLTGYLRNYIYYYAGIAKPLQDLKTALLKNSSDGAKRKAYTSKAKIAGTEKERAFYKMLQEALTKPTMLIHFNKDKDLWVDLDTSKEFGIGVIVFHLRDGTTVPLGKWPARTSIQPIMFLSRLLSSAEQNYWPTELETAGLVWTLKKIRHIVESASKVIIQTDHSAILDIWKQKLITASNSTMRANVRLVRASQFLS